MIIDINKDHIYHVHSNQTFELSSLHDFYNYYVRNVDITIGNLIINGIGPKSWFWSHGSHHTHVFINEFTKHMKTCKSPRSRKDLVDKIVVSFYSEMSKHDGTTMTIKNGEFIKIPPKTKTTRTEFHNCHSVHAVIGKEEFGVDFMKPSFYKKAKLEIDNNYKIHKHTHSFRRSYFKTEEAGIYQPQVHELINALLHEFSFHGTPNETQKKVKELKERFEKYK